MLLVALSPLETTPAKNFSARDETARQFGVHEVVLQGDGEIANPLDTVVTVTFTPPSGTDRARTVDAFFDGANTWRARVYVSEPGTWSWRSACAIDQGLDGSAGMFQAEPSELRGRLLPHPQNARQWITEDGRWFLNLSDTAYFLLCQQDGNGTPVSDDDARRYLRDDVSRGITSVRCFLASHRGGFTEARDQWHEWYFSDQSLDRFGLPNLQGADRRLRMMLNEFPDVAVQLILFPLEAYGRDDQFWSALTPVQRDRLLRHLVARFAAFPQLLWLTTNDAHYGDKFPNNNAMARYVGQYLQTHDPWRHPRSTGHARRLPFYFADENWATYIHLEHAHDLGAQQYAPYHAFAKPVFLGEDRYEQDHGPRQDPQHMRYWQRRLFWTWLLAGGSANYGGRWWTVHPYSETGKLATAYHKRPEVTFREPLTGLDSVRVIRDYFRQRSIDLGQFEPTSAMAASSPDENAQSPRGMSRGSSEFLFYHPNAAEDGQMACLLASEAARVRLDFRHVDGPFAVEWFRAEDGQVQRGDDVSGGALLELQSPWVGQDVVVRLTRR